MGNLKSFVAICTLFLSLLNVNTSDGQSLKSRPTAVNIIVILDTSDRVSNEKHPGQVERDRNIVKEIVARFEEVVKVNVGKSTEFAYQDQLTIIVPDQPTVPPIPLKIMMNLTTVTLFLTKTFKIRGAKAHTWTFARYATPRIGDRKFKGVKVYW